jgi:hypothetical protein
MLKMFTTSGSVMDVYESITQILSKDASISVHSERSYGCSQFERSHVCRSSYGR